MLYCCLSILMAASMTLIYLSAVSMALFILVPLQSLMDSWMTLRKNSGFLASLMALIEETMNL